MKFLMDLLSRTPIWAIRPEAIATALTALRNGLEAHTGQWEAAKPTVIGPSTNKVAVIPIQGVLSMDGPSWYGSNYNTISKAVEDAASNPEVKAIVLQVDSPGGEVTGLPETAAIIAAAAQKKPVTAMVEGMSASAAYFLSSQANQIVLTPSGEVGSVGVRMMHVDVSGMLEGMGYKVTELYSGDFKTEWSPYKPLSDEAKADMMPRLEAVHTEFINAVQAGRGARVTEDIKSKRFGEGRMFSSDSAIAHGLVDKVQSSREFFRSMIPAETAAPMSFPLHSKKHELERAKSEIK
jgi:capsid assembly protease